jgi:energy-coupling factor transporter ATP-binding protein EcfA2
MGEYDFTKHSSPIPKKAFDLGALLESMHDMENEQTEFVGAFYGEAGSGKTTTSMMFAQLITPPDKKILYYGTNKGYSALKNFPKLMNRVKHMEYTDGDQFTDLIDMLKNPAIGPKLKIGTVVFDEHNTMFDLETERITNIASWQLMKDKGIYKDPDTPEWPEYNKAKRVMINKMNEVLQIPETNFIFVCHPREGKKSHRIEPDYFDKAAQAFLRVVHSLYYLQTEEINGKVERSILLEGTDQITAKNRIGGLPRVVTNVKQIADAYLVWAEGTKKEAVKPEEPVAVESAPVSAAVIPSVETVEETGGETFSPQELHDNEEAFKEAFVEETVEQSADDLMDMLNL